MAQLIIETIALIGAFGFAVMVIHALADILQELREIKGQMLERE